MKFCGSQQIYIDKLALRPFWVAQACCRHMFTYKRRCNLCISLWHNHNYKEYSTNKKTVAKTCEYICDRRYCGLFQLEKNKILLPDKTSDAFTKIKQK